jgi:DNA gyrase/topoisomerase IV subunit B
MNKNRFAGLTAVKTLQKSDTIPTPKKETKARQKVNTAQETTAQTVIIAPRRGRPNGKRSNENFRQVTAYIGTETYKQTKMKLLANDNKQEFSELVDELLNRWLKEN